MAPGKLYCSSPRIFLKTLWNYCSIIYPVYVILPKTLPPFKKEKIKNDNKYCLSHFIS